MVCVVVRRARGRASVRGGPAPAGSAPGTGATSVDAGVPVPPRPGPAVRAERQPLVAQRGEDAVGVGGVVGGDAAPHPAARGRRQVGDREVGVLVELVEVEADERDVQAAEDGDLLVVAGAVDPHEPVLSAQT